MRQVVPYFDYRRQQLRVRDLNISYWDEGTGQPIVLIHGLGGFLEYWAWVFPQLIGQFRVIALDLPGFGESSVPSSNQLHIPDAVELLHEFVAALNLKNPILVGHSLGGTLALKCAATYPENYSSVMALCPPGFGREIDLVSRVLTLPVLGEMLFQPTHATIFRVLKCPNSVVGVDHLVKLTYERLSQPDARTRHLTMLRQGVNVVGQTFRLQPDQFRRCTKRVKVVWGDRDTIFPVKQAARVRDLLPTAELDIIPAGHMLLVEESGLISQLIMNFVGNQSAEAA